MIPQAQKSQAIDILIDLFAKVTLLSFDVHSTTMSLKKKTTPYLNNWGIWGTQPDARKCRAAQ